MACFALFGGAALFAWPALAEPPKTIRLFHSRPLAKTATANATASSTTATRTQRGLAQPLTASSGARTRLRLFREAEAAPPHREGVAVQRINYDQPAGSTGWHGRERQDETPLRAPTPEREPLQALPLEGLPLDGPAPADDGQAGWTPRASGARLLGQPVTPQPAKPAPAYARQQPASNAADAGQESANDAQVDPFDDPFGDGVGTARLTRRPTFNPLQDPASDSNATERPEEPPIPPTASDLSDSPADPTGQPRSNNPNCPHVFNGVNCCDEADRCDELKQMVANQSIRLISLDLTPRFKPGAELQEEDAEKRRRLAAVEARDWTDRNGNVVARGRFTDLRDHRVIVESGDGERVRLKFRELSEVDRCYVTAWWSLPTECTLTDQMYAGRHFQPITMTWKASALCHKPLYFEEVQLERYGHTMGPLVQPAFSTAHFFFNVAALPYNAGVHPMNECQYPLGHYRPGDCAPWLLPATPLSPRGALWQTGAVLGGVYMLP